MDSALNQKSRSAGAASKEESDYCCVPEANGERRDLRQFWSTAEKLPDSSALLYEPRSEAKWSLKSLLPPVVLLGLTLSILSNRPI